MIQLLIMHERQDQFDNKLPVLDNKKKAVADLQYQATNKFLDPNQVPPILNKDEVDATVYTQVNDRINIMKNIVVYNMPEGTSTLKAENATHDREIMRQLTEQTTDGHYQYGD